MLIEIDFNSDEAIYIQLRNQIIMGIATSTIHEGDTLPSVRQLADNIGINMHTVNKAYNVLRQEGFLQLDRRRGAVICIDEDKLEALQELKEQLRVLLAKGSCAFHIIFAIIHCQLNLITILIILMCFDAFNFIIFIQTFSNFHLYRWQKGQHTGFCSCMLPSSYGVFESF